MFVVVASFLGNLHRVRNAALTRSFPSWVKRDEIATAIALDRSVFHGSRWSVLARGNICGVVGRRFRFFANAGSFFALVIALISCHRALRNSRRGRSNARIGFQRGDYAMSKLIALILCMIGLIALTTIFGSHCLS